MKTLLLGLDGFDPGLAEEFDLPNIESVGEGFTIDTHGNSGPSWTSVITGRRPEHHGINMLAPGQNRYSWEGEPIWEKVDGYVGIANVPLTYPPAEVNGYMVTSFMTPSRAIYTYPRQLYQDLDNVGYRIDVWVEPGQHRNHPNGTYGMVPFEFTNEYREELMVQLEEVIRARGRGFRYLLKEEPTDFAFMVFTALDRIQHLAFHDKSVIRRFYELVDDEVGQLLELVPEPTDIFVTSDHGFQAIARPTSDLTGDHRLAGYGSTNTDARWSNLEELHQVVVETANQSDVKGRLEDLGYIEQ